jgi:hypothetical protein
MTPAIRIIIPAMNKTTPAIIPPKKFILSWLFAPTNGRLPANTPMLTGVLPKFWIVIVYFPTISGLNVVKNCFVNSLLVLTDPFGFRIVSLRVLFDICPCPALEVLFVLRSTCIANDTGLEVSDTWIVVFTKPVGRIEIPFRMVFSRINGPANDPAHSAEMTIPEINKAPPIIK